MYTFKKSVASTAYLSASLLGVILALSACAVGPDFKKPDTPKPSSFTREQITLDSKAVTPIKADWWKSYNSPELTKLV